MKHDGFDFLLSGDFMPLILIHFIKTRVDVLFKNAFDSHHLTSLADIGYKQDQDYIKNK